MPTPIRPGKYARAAGHDPTDFVKAVKSGEPDYAGIPIGSWRQDGGEFLAVPDAHANELGLSGAARSNGLSLSDLSNLPPTPGEFDIEAEIRQIKREARENSGMKAFGEAAPPVSANAGAAYASGKMAETLKEQPQLMQDFADITALLGAGGLAYATSEGDSVVKAGTTAAGMFAVWKILRHVCTQSDRQTDMRERAQRAQIQQQNQDQIPGNGEQKQLNGRRNGGTQTVGTH
jgi:hypothetical protein